MPGSKNEQIAYVTYVFEATPYKKLKKQDRNMI